MGKYVVKKTKTGIKFDLKAGNGEVIANSEVYKSTLLVRRLVMAIR